MHHFLALAFGLITLGLVCSTRYSLMPSRTESLLHSEIYLSILVSSLTGFMLLTVAILAKQLWPVVGGDFSHATPVTLGVDAAAAGLIVASLVMLTAIMKAAGQNAKLAGTVPPFPTRPVTPNPTVHIDKKAA